MCHRQTNTEITKLDYLFGNGPLPDSNLPAACAREGAYHRVEVDEGCLTSDDVSRHVYLCCQDLRVTKQTKGYKLQFLLSVVDSEKGVVIKIYSFFY